MRIIDWSSDVCSSDLGVAGHDSIRRQPRHEPLHLGGDGFAKLARLLDDFHAHPIAGADDCGERCKADDQQPPCAAYRKHPAQKTRAAVQQGGKDNSGADEQDRLRAPPRDRSEAHTSELPSLMRNSYAVFCSKKNTTT